MIFTLASCENYLGNGTNNDPNRVFEDEIGLAELLPTVLKNTSDTHFSIAFTTGQYVQHISFVGNTDKQEESTLAGSWSNIYLASLSNLDVMEQKATEQNAAHYLGIVKVMQALNLGLLTDTWEDVPYTQAFMGVEEFTPAFDPQEQLYPIIQQLLDEAITELEKPDSEFLEPGSEDIIYGGNISKWLKTAYALKARYAIHLINQGEVNAAENALSALQNAYTDNSDDLQVNYSSTNLNPWHTDAFLASQTGNPAPIHSDQLIDMMNGTTYPERDPRLPIIASKGSADEFYGGINGSFGFNPVGPDNSSTTDFTAGTFYSTPAAPIFMITYAETKLIEAEAAFLRDNSGNRFATGASQQAYDAYLEGIRAHMNKIGVSAAERDGYLNEPTVAVGAANLTMELIMKEKFKALFLNPEIFNDLRRYDFNSQIFKDLELPIDHNPELNGQWIQRAVYPSSEFSRNEEEVEQAVKDIGTEMWYYSN
jgi:hypothetical protein